MTDISYGPFILALTPHSVIAAPPDEARRILTDAKVSYVMVCGPRPPDGLPEPARSRSLWSRLQAGASPTGWLPVPGARPFAAYRVRP